MCMCGSLRLHVGVFGGQGFVLAADHVPQPFDCVVQIHNRADFGRPGWTQAVQGSISIHEPAVAEFEASYVDQQALAQFLMED